MGGCVKSASVNIPILQPPKIIQGSTYPTDSFNLAMIKQYNDQVILKHSPLYANVHLKKLFDTNSMTPQQITFNYCLKQKEIDMKQTPELLIEGTGKANVWIIISGKEYVHPPTQLTTKIKDYAKCQKKPLDTNKLQTFRIQLNGLYHTQNKTDMIMIIESLSQKQSRYMIHSFELQKDTLKLIKHTYNWCGLSFLIQDIYGAMQDQMNAQAMQYCAICMSELATTIFIPCRHMCVCQQCAKTFMKITKQTCPICRKVYSNLIAYIQNDNNQP